jgi:diguanylate cyclase (GGDEF)-like protein
MNTRKVASLKTAHASGKTTTGRQSAPVQKQALQTLTDGSLLQLHQFLQGQTNVQTVVLQYHTWLNKIQRADGTEYVHSEEQIAVTAGSLKAHKVSYALKIEDGYFGTLTVSSQKRFTEQDLFDQEQSMTVLIHYLKVALQFHRLEKQALHDPLTGVMNRAALDNLLPREISRARRYSADLSILVIDIDHFKSINDHAGHLAGDRILKTVANTITASVRCADMTFRFGGDEFVVLLPSTDLQGAHTAAENIAQALRLDHSPEDQYQITPQLSIGVASYRRGEKIEDLLSRADGALYNAKKNGRNCVC